MAREIKLMNAPMLNNTKFILLPFKNYDSLFLMESSGGY